MIREIKFNIYKPINLNEIFDIPEDTSVWMDEPRYVINKSGNHVPNRDISLSGSELIIPKNEVIKKFFNKKSSSNYGVYILIFEDFKKFYVGIAARYSYCNKNGILKKLKSPEGFFTRLKKHRAKCTGTTASGVNHTNSRPYGWRDFALEREAIYNKNKQIDTMTDCLLSLITFNCHEDYENNNDKGILESLESHINKNGLSKYFGLEFDEYESFAHTNSKDLSFNPVLSNIDFTF